MKKVYALGVLQIDTNPDARRTIKEERLWHLFASFEEAEQAMLSNSGDLFEYYYNYGLIEEIYVIDSTDKPEPGEIAWPPQEWWYFADYTINPPDERTNWSEPVIKACEKPAVLDRCVHFWVG
jgi:hypothetical protein